MQSTYRDLKKVTIVKDISLQNPFACLYIAAYVLREKADEFEFQPFFAPKTTDRLQGTPRLPPNVHR
jgi:hypothetical protein